MMAHSGPTVGSQFRRGALGRTVLVVALAAACLLGPALAAADALLDEAKGHLAANNPKAAYELLVQHQSDRAGQPDFDYLLGVAALDSGRLTEAVFALERVLAVEPDNTLARAEIARAYLLMGETITARRQFETVTKAKDVPQEAKEAIAQYLSAFETAPRQGTDFRGYIAVIGGYDSNVNAATDVESVAIPAVGNTSFRLDPTAREADAAFLTVAAGGSFTHPIRQDLRLQGALNGYSRFLSQNTGFETADGNGYLGLDYIRGATTYTLAGQFDHFRYSHDTLRNAYGGLLQARTTLTPVTQMTGFFQYSRQDYHGNESFRDANRYTVGVGFSRVFAGKYTPTGFISGFGGVEDQDDDALDFVGYDFAGVRLGGDIRINQKTSVFGFFNYQHRNYGGRDLLFLTDRRDDQFGVRVGGEYRFAPGWSVMPSVDYINNQSTVSINEYDRWIVAASLRRDFD